MAITKPNETSHLPIVRQPPQPKTVRLSLYMEGPHLPIASNFMKSYFSYEISSYQLFSYPP